MRDYLVRRCRKCGKEMNPVDTILTDDESICHNCSMKEAREHHRRMSRGR